MPIIDTHCHYNLPPLHSEWQNHWRAAQEHDVVASIIPGADQASLDRGLTIAGQEPHLFAALGYHPNYCQDELILDHIAALAAKLPHPKVVAIGEVGLDYFRISDPALQDMQRQAFIAQIQLAETHRLPLLIHVRDKIAPETPVSGNAYWDLLEILKHHSSGHQPMVLHCVSGPLRYLQVALELGAYIGVAGNVTYKNADAIRQLVKATPADRILLETDAPYLPPQDFRGQTCQPWMISTTAAFLENTLGISQDQVYQTTSQVFRSTVQSW